MQVLLHKAATLTLTLVTFKAKVTPASEEMLLAWRDGPHDDLVLGVVFAAPMVEHLMPTFCIL